MRRRQAPSDRRPTPLAGGAGLARKFAALSERYRALAAKHARGTAKGASATLLAVAAMRAGATALAAIRDGRCVVRNDRWVALARRRGAPWRCLDGGRREEHPTLEALALTAAAELSGGRPTCMALRCERGDGAFVVDVRLERARVESPPLLLATITDVTERVRGERELARRRGVVESQEQLRAIGELASGVAHDLNNTLHALRLRLARLSECVTGDLEHEEDLRVVERIAADAAARVRRLQDLSHRREDVPDERVDPAVVVGDAVEMVRSQLSLSGGSSRVAIEVAIPALPPVVGNRAELDHVVVSLLLNALDAMPEGGRVTVAGGVAADGQVELVVEDEGSGIPADHLGRIFEPFFTTKGRRCTGLGLSVAAGVMRRLGGSIRAGNRAAGGASFTLRFPPPRGEGRASDAPATELAVARQPRRVLVVDDDPDNLEAMRLVLLQFGHEVEVTESGLDAIERIEAGERYDTIFCDLGLGDTTGWEVAARIAAAAPRIRILLVTGWADEIPADDPRRRHAAAVLPKPLGADQLRELAGVAPPSSGPLGRGRDDARGSRSPPP